MAFDDDDDGDADVISDSVTSIVTRFESELPDGLRFIAVKTSSTMHAKEPHDIIKEVRLLTSLSHPNIIPLIKQELTQRSQYLSFWMPYLPYSLDDLLRSSRFSPHPIVSFGKTASVSPAPREVEFVTLAKSIMFQVLCGVSYLHGEHVQIAHRDIKPSNVLLTPSGRAWLIDFGIAFRVGEDDFAKAKDLWPESAARMYFEVSTGPYRAPELLFGPRTYDAFAIDTWSLGVTFAEFFTSLRLENDPDEDDADGFLPEYDCTLAFDSESESGPEACAPTPAPTPFVISQGTRPVPTGRWTRANLFDGSRGEIGLAWSIFKIRGTPNRNTWPSFLNLPDAKKLAFVDVPAVELSYHLPNLPASTSSLVPSASASIPSSIDTRTHAPSSSNVIPSPLDLVHRFLVYEPAWRLRPSDALRHPWFRAEPGLVAPADDDDDDDRAMNNDPWGTEVARTFTMEGETRTLRDLLLTHVASVGNRGY